MILNTHYAYGAGVSGAVIIVSAPTGSTVTATLDGTVYTAQEVNGTWTFKVRKFGVYTVKATRSGQSAQQNVNVTQATTYRVTLNYVQYVNVVITGNGEVSSIRPQILASAGGYYSAGTYQIVKGSALKLYVKVNCEGARSDCNITVNGRIVATANNEIGATAEYTIYPSNNVNVTLSLKNGTTGKYGKVVASY